MTDPRESVPVQIKVVTAVVGLIGQCIAGVFFMGGGAWLVTWALHHEQHNFVYLGVAVAVGGAWILPGLFSTVKNIYITIFPNGIPLPGGRRSGDPAAPPTGPQP